MAYGILVVDDDEDVAETIERTLLRADYDVRVAHRGAEALDMARQRKPDLVILDIMMPGMDGVEVARHLRANPEWSGIPILCLTAKTEISDKIEVFGVGVDDYLTKPFDLRELELRVKALLRRSHRGEQEAVADLVEIGDLVLDCRTYELSTPECKVLLTPVEFALMQFLMGSPGRVFSAEQLLQQVWDYPPGTGMPDLVRVHIKNIREKIEPNPRKPRYLKNVLRRGYTVNPNGG